MLGIKSTVTKGDVEDILCEKSLYSFVKKAWKCIEPRPFVPNWHIEAICEHLEAVTNGQIKNLIINVPPRHTKSLTVSVMWPAWEWGPKNKPDTRWLFISYAAGLTIRDSVKCRLLMQSPWYASVWGKRFYLMGDQNAKERYNTNRHGYRIASSVGGLGTGEGGDRIVVDDPINVDDALSDAVRNGVNEWWDNAMATRANDPKASGRIIIMQRSHENDLVGHIKSRGDSDYEYLILPAEFIPSKRCKTSIGWKDPRKQPDEILWKGRFDKPELDALKKSLGSYNSSAQLQQEPAPIEGGLFKRYWWKFYGNLDNKETEHKKSAVEIAKDCQIVFQSWDMAFKGLDHSDFVVGQVWGVNGARRYLLDQVRERLTFTQTKAAVKNLSNKWPKATAKYVEDKANGPAIIDDLKTEVSGIIAINPEGSKEARAMSITPECEAGNVYLPHPSIAEWVNAFIEELAQFNKGPNDDQVDSASQALNIAKKKMNQLAQFAPIVSLTKGSGLTDHRTTKEVLESVRW